MGLFSSKKQKNQPVSTPAEDLAAMPTLAKEDRKTAKQYDRAIWWVTHRELLKKIGIGCVLVVEVLLGLFGLWKYADYFLFDYVEEERLVLSFFEGTEEIADTTRIQAPTELAVSTATTLNAGDAFDLVAFVTNENPQWVAQVTYHFSYDGGSTDEQEIIVLQDSTYPLTAFDLDVRPQRAELVVQDIAWYRIDQQDIRDPAAWKHERLNLTIDEVEHDDSFRIGEETFGKTAFQLTNNTGFGYYEVDLFVVIKRSSAVVGVNRTVLTNLEPTEKRFVQLNWFSQTPAASTVEVYPVVNLFDHSVYLPTSTSVQEDVRDIRLRRR